MKNSNKKKKNSKKELPQNTELRVFSIIRIKNDKLEKESKDLLFAYKRFGNILLILINQNYNLYKDGKDTNDFNLLASPQFMRNALYDYNSKHLIQLEYLENRYKDNQLWQTLKETAKKLKLHNVIEIINGVKANFKAYFTILEVYKQNPSLFTGMPKPPKSKKLSKITNYSVELDKYNSLSFTKLGKENKVFNVDINAEANHIKVGAGKSFEWLKSKLFKLCNPIKIKSDYKFCRLLKSLWNSELGKSTLFIGTEVLQPNKLIENISCYQA
jgi:hypothetical protein